MQKYNNLVLNSYNKKTTSKFSTIMCRLVEQTENTLSFDNLAIT